MKKISFIIVVATLISFQIRAADLPGCLQAQYYLKILDLYELTHPSEVPALRSELNYVKFQACSGAFRQDDTVRYKNGKTATSYAGREDATWYWPNGKTITSYALREDATVYYPNGNIMTSYFLRTDATYYYGNNKTITSYSGRPGATFYLIAGSSTSSPGFVDSSGTLDFIRFADYIVILNSGVTPPSGGCSIANVKTDIQQAKALIQNGQSSQAISILSHAEGCL